MPRHLLITPSRHFPISFFRCQPCLFHTSRLFRVNGVVNHYEILGLEPSASLTDVKKSVASICYPRTRHRPMVILKVSYCADCSPRNFYALSKKHHPDHNPDDANAAERFVEISEAYAVLGNPSKREKYDREIWRTVTRTSDNGPRGSYSSSAPYGARPASGLSKRRTQFRGPPPSFYRNGAWGQHGAKRRQEAGPTTSAHRGAASDSFTTGAQFGGFGPSGSLDGFDHDVPHFDRQGHIRTQEQQDQRRVRRADEETVDYVNGGSMLLNFFFVSGILAVASLAPGVFVSRKNSRKSDADPQ